MRTPRDPRMATMPGLVLLLALLLAVGLGAGCATQVEHPEDVMRLLAESNEVAGNGFEPVPQEELVDIDVAPPAPYVLGIGDVVYVSVPGQEAFAGFGETAAGDIVGTRIKEDGNLYLPLVQKVPAAGKTVIELQDAIEERLEQFVERPFVSADVIAFHSKKFYVLGEVVQPGSFPVNGRTTLIEALTMAGGPHNGDADLDEAYIIRDGETLPLSIADVIQHGAVAGDLVMEDRDLIFVPHKDMLERRVYVLGEVNSPGPVPIPSGQPLTLSAAIAAAGDLNPESAAQDQIRIFRGGWKLPKVYTVSAHELHRYGESLLLHPGDRIFVAPSGLATWGRALKHITPFLGLTGAAAGIAALATN